MLSSGSPMPMNTTFVTRLPSSARRRARSGPGRRSRPSRGRARSRARRSRRTGQPTAQPAWLEMHTVFALALPGPRRVAHEDRLDEPAVVERVERLLGQARRRRRGSSVAARVSARNASVEAHAQAAPAACASSSTVGGRAGPTRGPRPGAPDRPADRVGEPGAQLTGRQAAEPGPRVALAPGVAVTSSGLARVDRRPRRHGGRLILATVRRTPAADEVRPAAHQIGARTSAGRRRAGPRAAAAGHPSTTRASPSPSPPDARRPHRRAVPRPALCGTPPRPTR